jgi:hypothetical protein
MAGRDGGLEGSGVEDRDTGDLDEEKGVHLD